MANVEISPSDLSIELVSAAPGRVRLRSRGIPAETTARAISERLRDCTSIREVVGNERTGSIIIRFEARELSACELLEEFLPEVRKTPQPSPHQSAGAIASEIDWTDTYTRLKSWIPPILGLVFTRTLRISGWPSLLSYLVFTAIAREALDYLETEGDGDGETPEAPVRVPIASGAYEVVHAIDGRIRLKIPQICEDPAYCDRLEAFATEEDWIDRLTLNRNTGSAIVAYNVGAIADNAVPRRLHQLLERAAGIAPAQSSSPSDRNGSSPPPTDGPSESDPRDRSSGTDGDPPAEVPADRDRDGEGPVGEGNENPEQEQGEPREAPIPETAFSCEGDESEPPSGAPQAALERLHDRLSTWCLLLKSWRKPPVPETHQA
ncbi:hypothetical protein JJD41_06330 [Oxynema sp. CENA135]|uniref:HMA2 domain-containing protein n=1 Tax=Oxynema sp. CENA135 TaxID=984206 RepID=UPI00190ABBBB|nr:hypothetical protein [Oxynema sp. CENA135]MBK4729482.1 hypothetical protein [Oxynema sp. CENA135]